MQKEQKLPLYILKKLLILESDSFFINKSLYDFQGKNVLRVIKELNDSFNVVMIVGHNHAFTSIVNMLGDDYY